jgi:hypothetical protein
MGTDVSCVAKKAVSLGSAVAWNGWGVVRSERESEREREREREREEGGREKRRITDSQSVT